MATRNKYSSLMGYYFFIGFILLLVFLYDKYKDSFDLDDIKQTFKESNPSPAPAPVISDPDILKERQSSKEQRPPEQKTDKKNVDDATGTPVDFYTVQRFGPVPESVNPESQKLFREYYEAKLNNPAYVAKKSEKGLPKDYQHYPEEKQIKAARSRVAAKMTAPAGVTPVAIPVTEDNKPSIDGYVEPDEWADAVVLLVGGGSIRTRVFLKSNGKKLFIACTVPDDVTEKGYDQFRFYYHLNITPDLANERIHVSGSGRAMVLRATNIRWTGEKAQNNDERWKNYPISDWVIYKKHKAKSQVNGFRQYEASLNLEEAGLHIGVPFPARIEVETDPDTDEKGKFKQRKYLGELGTPENPFWFVIEDAG